MTRNNNLETLQKRLKALEISQKSKKNQKKSPHVIKIGIDFFSPIFFTLCVGYYIGNKTNSMVVSMVISLILGFGAGVLNVIRSTVNSENRND